MKKNKRTRKWKFNTIREWLEELNRSPLTQFVYHNWREHYTNGNSAQTTFAAMIKKYGFHMRANRVGDDIIITKTESED